MGVLDDAIREHLELKRRRGADASEVERQAAEALGPARREPPPAPAVEPADADAEAELEPMPAEYAETAVEQAPQDYGAELPVAELPEDLAEAEPPTQLAEDLVPPAGEPAFEPEPEPVAPAEDPEPEAAVTPLHPVEDEDEPDEVPADERLTDQGPLDFPSEKREDKPLWFEQSPGRDLDFDD